MNRPHSVVLIAFVSWMLTIVGCTRQVEPADAKTAIPISELTPGQYENLADNQVISSGEMRITLGELRALHAERRKAREAATAEREAMGQALLEKLESEYAAQQAERARADAAQVTALMAHFDELAEANPEMVRRAEELSAQRREAYRQWIRSIESATD